MTKTKDFGPLDNSLRVLEIFRSATGDAASLKLVESFLLAARHEGLGVVELAKKAGSTRTTMSRHMMDLSGQLRNGGEGYKLLQRHQDPSNMRAVYFTITPKGERVLDQLQQLWEK